MELRRHGRYLGNVRCDAPKRSLTHPASLPIEKPMCSQTPNGPVWPWNIPVHVRLLGDFEGFGFGWKRWRSGEKGRKWVGEKTRYFCIVGDEMWCTGWICVYCWDPTATHDLPHSTTPIPFPSPYLHRIHMHPCHLRHPTLPPLPDLA